MPCRRPRSATTSVASVSGTQASAATAAPGALAARSPKALALARTAVPVSEQPAKPTDGAWLRLHRSALVLLSTSCCSVQRIMQGLQNVLGDALVHQWNLEQLFQSSRFNSFDAAEGTQQCAFARAA